MKPGTLVRIEFIKTVKRRAFWVTLAFLTLICVVSIVSEMLQGRKGMGAPFVAPYTWAMTVTSLGPMPGFFLAMIVVMLVTSEYSWRTARQNVIDGLSKEQFFAAKWLMTMLVTLAIVAIPFIVATGTAIYGRIAGAVPTSQSTAADAAAASRDSVDRAKTMAAQLDSTRQALAAARTAADSARVMARARSDSTQAALRQALRDVRSQRSRAAYPAPDPAAPLVAFDEMKVAFGYALASLGFASMGFMLAVLLRSTGGAIGVFFLYFAFLEQLIGLLIRRFGSEQIANNVMPYMPLNVFRAPLNATAWSHPYLERLNTIAASLGQPPREIDPEYLKLIGLPLVWILVFVAVAFAVFRQRDL